MKVVIGGAWQGKKDFALELAKARSRAEQVPRVLDGGRCSLREIEQLEDGAILDHFHLLVRRMLEAERVEKTAVTPGEEPQGLPADELARSLLARDRLLRGEAAGESAAGHGTGLIVVCNELGCGIVPMDPMDRAWREKTGRLLCDLAREAEEVYRVVAGVGVRIK